MPLTTAQITSWYRAIASCRDDWDAPGIHSAVATVGADSRPWPALVRQLAVRCGEAKWRTPAGLLEPLTDAVPQGGQGISSAVSMLQEKREPCDKCGSTQQRNDGECLGCWQNRVLDGPA